ALPDVGAEERRRAQDRAAAEQSEDRAGEYDGGEQRDDRPDAEREGEALDARGRQTEEDERGQQRDHVRVDDRADAALVSRRDRRDHRVALAGLLLYSLEDDDVRVRRDADREDQTRDSRQRQGD